MFDNNLIYITNENIYYSHFYKAHHASMWLPVIHAKQSKHLVSNKVFINNRVVVEITLVSVAVDSYYRGDVVTNVIKLKAGLVSSGQEFHAAASDYTRRVFT